MKHTLELQMLKAECLLLEARSASRAHVSPSCALTGTAVTKDAMELLRTIRVFRPPFPLPIFEIQAYLLPGAAQLECALTMWKDHELMLIDNPDWHRLLYEGFHPYLHDTPDQPHVIAVLLYAAHHSARLAIDPPNFVLDKATAALAEYSERLGELLAINTNSAFTKALLDEVRLWRRSAAVPTRSRAHGRLAV